MSEDETRAEEPVKIDTEEEQPIDLQKLEHIEECLKDALIGAPVALICRRRKNESHVDLDFKCPRCKFPAVVELKFSSSSEPVYYHLLSEKKALDTEDECLDQLVMACSMMDSNMLVESLVTLSAKYTELLK